MVLTVSHAFFRYEAENLCRLFYPYEPLKITEDPVPAPPDDFTVRAESSESLCRVSIRREEKTLAKESAPYDPANREYSMVRLLYLALTEFSGYRPQWGLLTGIHPVKLYTLSRERLGTEPAERAFRERYFVTEEKTELCRRIEKIQRPVGEQRTENDFALYLSVPFCPTRCAYCSFVSQSVEKQKRLVAPYVEKLLEEIADTARITRETGLRPVSVYMGGGTPTTLSAEQLRQVIAEVKLNFDLSACEEFTVEAGRPDTIDREKLEALTSSGVTRISVNPQSLQDQVLVNIGRKHTAAQVIEAYNLAREAGVGEINMDLIAGLEGDTPETFRDTLERVIKLGPENVTVHSLALKRSAHLSHREDVRTVHENREAVREMIAFSIQRLTEAGYEPYYLYRQSRMAGDQENTGWAKPGTLCRYNIYTMEETLSVIACGAGGVSKLKDPYSDRLERVFNFKYSHEYLSRFDEILKRKEEVKVLYEQFRQRIHQVHQSFGTDQ